MLRRQFLKTAAAPALLCAQTPKRPNIVVLFTDDQRFDTIGALGHPQVKTPNMDRLVRSGIAFTRAGIMGGTIPAVCAPSRAMLWTGQTLFHVHDSLITPKPGARPYDLVPELLRKAGYSTFGTGKWHNGDKTYARCFSSGGPVMFGGMAFHDKTPVADFDPAGDYSKGRWRTGEKFSSELFTDAAVGFLEKQKAGQPFFLYVGYTSPHDPRMAPKKFADMYDPAKIELPPNFLPEHPFDNGEMKVRDEKLADWPRTPQAVREHIAAYYAMISEVDAQIGRVLDTLDRTGLAADTVVIFAGDNGLAVGQHGLMGKQNMYDHSMRVPLVVSGPGVPKGKRSDSFVYLLDLAPTICEFAGIPVPSSMEGQSILRKNSRESLMTAYRDMQRALRTDRWKLILYRVDGKETVQLFDLRADPWEKKNLAGETSQSGTVSELRRKLQVWMKRVDDPWLSL